MEHRDSIEFKTSPRDIEKFKNGDVWDDMCLTIDDKLSHLYLALSIETDTVEIYRMQGRIEELIALKELPGILMESIKEELEYAEEKREQSPE